MFILVIVGAAMSGQEGWHIPATENPSFVV